MGTLFYVIVGGGFLVSLLAVLCIAMPLDFAEPPWRIFGKSGNK